MCAMVQIGGSPAGKFLIVDAGSARPIVTGGQARYELRLKTER